MNDSDIPIKIGVAFAQNAGPTFITKPLPVGSQIGTVNGAASFNDGFVPLNMLPLGSGGVPPFGQDMNGVLFAISAWTRWANAGGPISYDAAFSTAVSGYPAGAVLSANGTPGAFWFNQLDSNGSNPDTGGANWIGFTPLDLMATDTGAGGVNAIVANLPVNPPSWAWMAGRPFLVRKTGTNLGATVITLNSLSPSKVITHVDSSNVSKGELVDAGWLDLVYDLTNDIVQILSPAGALTQATLPTAPGAIKAWANFYWTGSTVQIRDSYNVAGIVRTALGTYQVTLSGNLTFLSGYCQPNGGGALTGLRGPGAAIGIGSSFVGLNPVFTVWFGNAGGSGGVFSDPADASIVCYGSLQ